MAPSNEKAPTHCLPCVKGGGLPQSGKPEGLCHSPWRALRYQEWQLIFLLCLDNNKPRICGRPVVARLLLFIGSGLLCRKMRI